MNHDIADIIIIVLVIAVIALTIAINHTIKLLNMTIERVDLINDARSEQINLLIELAKTQDNRIDGVNSFMLDKIIPALSKSHSDIYEVLEALNTQSRYIIQYLMESPEFKEWVGDKIKDLDNDLDVDLDINDIITDIERRHNLNDGDKDA
jgi:hypothetical protein